MTHKPKYGWAIILRVTNLLLGAGWSKHATRIKAARAVRLLESKPIGATAVELGRDGTQLAVTIV